MSTRTLPDPASFRDRVKYRLTGPDAPYSVMVTPRDEQGRESAGWSAYWYEVCAFYAEMGRDMAALEAMLAALPGCVRTTQVAMGGAIRDTDWPGFSRRKHRSIMRPQVLALFADPPGEAGQ